MPDIQLYNQDCVAGMSNMARESVQAVITDPPYGIDYQSNRRVITEKFDKIDNDSSVPVEWMQHAFNIIKWGGCIFCFCRWDTEHIFREELKNAGFVVKSQVIWDRGVHGLGDLYAQYAPQHDNAIFAVKGNFKFPGDRPNDVYRYMRVPHEDLLHPNEKPLSLMTRIVLDLTGRQDTVLDPFMGSATTGVACYNTGRNFIGYESMKQYFIVAKKRIEDTKLKPSFFQADSFGMSEEVTQKSLL